MPGRRTPITAVKSHRRVPHRRHTVRSPRRPNLNQPPRDWRKWGNWRKPARTRQSSANPFNPAKEAHAPAEACNLLR